MAEQPVVRSFVRSAGRQAGGRQPSTVESVSLCLALHRTVALSATGLRRNLIPTLSTTVRRTARLVEHLLASFCSRPVANAHYAVTRTSTPEVVVGVSLFRQILLLLRHTTA